MFIATTLVLSLILLVHTFVIEKNCHNPLTLFLAIFAPISMLSGLQLYGLRDFDQNIYWLILIGCTALIVGYYSSRFGKTKIVLAKKEQHVLYSMNEKLLGITSIILLAFYLLISLKVLHSITFSGYSYAEVKSIYGGTDEDLKVKVIYGMDIVKTIDLMIMRSAMNVVMVLTIIRFFRKKKFDFQFFITLLSIIFYILVNYSRITLIVILVQIVTCAILVGVIDKENIAKIKKAIRKYIVPIVFVAIIAIFVISEQRSSGHVVDLPFAEELYTYTSIPLPLFAHYKESIDAQGIMTWGVMFTKGFANFIMTFLGRLGISIPILNTATEIVNETQNFIYLFPGHSVNAFTTLFYYFYVDFGILGVILESAAFGWILGYSFKAVKSANAVYNERAMAFYLLLLQAIVKSFIRWEFVQMSYAMSFILLILFFKPKYNNITER